MKISPIINGEVVLSVSGTLRTFARNFSNIDFFSEKFTFERS